MQLLPYNKYVRLAVLLVLLAASSSLGLSILIPHLLDLNNYRAQLTETLKKQLHRDVSLGNCKFSWILRPSFSFSDLKINERGTSADFLSARHATFKIALLPLLLKKVELHEIELEEVRLHLGRDQQGTLNIDDLLKTEPGSYELQVKGLKLRNATFFWQDLSQSATSSLVLSEINLNLGNLKRGKKSSCKLAAKLNNGSGGSLKASGHFRTPSSGNLLRNVELDLKIELNQFAYGHFWPYFGTYIPFPSPNGTLTLNSTVKGHWQNLHGKLDLNLNNASLQWPRVFRGKVAPRKISLTTAVKWTPNFLELPDLRVALDGFAIRGGVKLSDLNTNDPLLAVHAQSESFDYLKVRNYIPFGILEDGPAEFIEKRIRGGIFKLSTGTLNGRLSQIARFGEGDTANMLYINGTADQAVIQYGEKSPTFRQIKGILEMKGRDFTLTDMSGIFGNAPFTLSGAITEYATIGAPCAYPFSMTIRPTPTEVAWLSELTGLNELRFKGNDTTLRLQGSGPTSAYHVSGEWLLNQASYSYPHLINKQTEMANSLNFSAIIDSNQTRFTSVSYQLAPLRISGSGLFRYSGKTPYLAFDLESNQFHLDSRLPILTEWQKYQLHGNAQGRVQGAGDPNALENMLFTGSVKLSNFSIKPHANLKPVTDIATTVNFRGKSLDTSLMTIRYGSTPLTIRGSISNFANSEAELFISSPSLNPVDFGVSPKDKPSLIRQFSTQLGLGNNRIIIRNLQGKLPNSSISLAGTIQADEIPDLQLRIAASHLTIEELLPLFAADGTPDKQPTSFKLHADVSAENGSFLDTPFSRMSAGIRTENGVIKLKGLRCDLLGGKLALNGQLTRTFRQPLKWETSFTLEKAKSGELLHMLGINREIRGLATTQCSFIASGDTLQDIRRTVSGSIDLKVERGVLKRLKTLSKVISILNVSQLFTFNLPDMARDGMPFNQITATVAVKDGIFSTQDFFIDSSVMDISSVGTIDVAREKINMLIGVRPLQTVDRVVSRIPVFGWILSGGDGSLITTYFEAKGNWDNPEVTAIPVKSIAKGTFEIFRRTFELPVRLFTDTGEVLLGNQKDRPKSESTAKP